MGGVVGLTSPAIGEDGTIYMGGADYRLFALNPNGSFKRLSSGWSAASCVR